MKNLNAEEVNEVSGGERAYDYIVVSGYSAEDLQDNVLESLGAGYTMWGSPFSRGLFGYMYQSMVKYVD